MTEERGLETVKTIDEEEYLPLHLGWSGICFIRSSWACDVAWDEVEGSKKTRRLGRQRRPSSIIRRASPIIEPRRSRQMGRHGTAKVWLRRPFRSTVTSSKNNLAPPHRQNATLPIPSFPGS